MKKLLVAMLLLMASIALYGQRVDFSTYDRVAKRGKVTIVCQKEEYRLIVGSLKNPEISLLIGTFPEAAASSLNSLLKKGDNEDSSHITLYTCLGGIRFTITVSGPSANRSFTLRGMDNPVRFRLSSLDIKAMEQAILEGGAR